MSYSFDDDLFFLSSLNEPMLSNDESQAIEEKPSIVQSDLICGVCGAPAHGFNFDQVTCESCKAFFRRNALKNTSQWSCRFSGSCPITIATRRQCGFCRLKKCFQIGMRKDWIRTEHERQYRRMQQLIKEQKRLLKNKTK